MTAPVVAVRGEVTRDVPPEIATVSVTVSARDRDRPAALARLAERSTALGRMLDGYAEAIDRRETSGLFVYPETKGPGERVVGYRGSVTVQVTFTDFGVLGDLLLRIADQDQTTVGGPYWALKPDSPAYRTARRDAIADAVARARDYADALGAQVVRLLELTDAGLSRVEPVQAFGGREVMRTFAAADTGGPTLNLEPAQQRVYASVEARFEMTEPRLR